MNSLPETIDLQDLLSLIQGLAIAHKTLFKEMGLIQSDANFDLFERLVAENPQFLEETYQSWKEKTDLDDKELGQLLQDKLGGI